MASLSNIERSKIINLLVRITKYSKRFYLKMHDSQLLAVYNKYISKRDELVNSLCGLVDVAGNRVCDYTRSQLLTFKIDKLEEIYNSYTVGQVSNYDIDDYQEYEFLTPDELTIIYGLDYLDMDVKDFKHDGFRVIEEDNCSLVFDIRNNVANKIKELIVNGDFKDNNLNKYTLSRLNKLSFDDLVQLYRTLTCYLDDYPSYESLEGGMRLSFEK